MEGELISICNIITMTLFLEAKYISLMQKLSAIASWAQEAEKVVAE